MSKLNKFNPIDNKVDFIKLEHEMLDRWESNKIFDQLREKNKNGKPWSFLDGPITANNPMELKFSPEHTRSDIFKSEYTQFFGTNVAWCGPDLFFLISLY